MSKAPKRYFGLRLISMIYKMLTILTVLVCIGALGYVSIAALQSPLFDVIDFQNWLPQALGLTIGGGLLALTFYVLSQMIDIQIEQNEALRSLIAHYVAMNENIRLTNANVQKLLDIHMKVESRAARLQAAESGVQDTKSSTKR